MSTKPAYSTLYNAVWELQDRLEHQLNTDYADLATQQKREATLQECRRIATVIDRQRLLILIEQSLEQSGSN